MDSLYKLVAAGCSFVTDGIRRWYLVRKFPYDHQLGVYRGKNNACICERCLGQSPVRKSFLHEYEYYSGRAFHCRVCGWDSDR